MGPRVLVTFPEACEVSTTFAGELNAILRDRALDSRLAPFGLAPGLDRFDGAVLGCSVDHGDPLDELARFAEQRAAELEDLPAALFVLGPGDARLPAALEVIRATVDPVSVGRFDPSDPGSREARRWAAQLAWTLACAARAAEEPDPLPYTVGL